MYIKNGVLDYSRIIKHGVSVLIILILAAGSVGTVNTGKLGIKTRNNRAIGIETPGLYFKLPFIDEVHEMDVQIQKEQAEASAASSDLQTVNATIAVNYNVDPSKILDLFSKIGVDYKTRIVDPAIQEATKAATAKYTAEQLITKREEVTSNIKDLLVERLGENFIHVDQVSIVHFDFSPSFNAAIEAKVTAEQNALAAKNKLDQVKYEAQQRVEQANGEAQAIAIQAKAITQQGGKEYVQLQWIKAWQDGGSKVPQTLLGSGSSNFLLNLNQ